MNLSRKSLFFFSIGITSILFNLTVRAENTDSAEYRAKVKKVCESYNKPVHPLTEIKKIACVYDRMENVCRATIHYADVSRDAIDCFVDNCSCGSIISTDTNCKEDSSQECIAKYCKKEINRLAQYGQTPEENVVCTTPSED